MFFSKLHYSLFFFNQNPCIYEFIATPCIYVERVRKVSPLGKNVQSKITINMVMFNYKYIERNIEIILRLFFSSAAMTTLRMLIPDVARLYTYTDRRMQK